MMKKTLAVALSLLMLLAAFPALGEGSHKEALSRIREKWEARKK